MRNILPLLMALALNCPELSAQTITIGPDSIPPYNVTGIILDYSTGQFLQGANIYLPDQNIVVTSDSDGRYTLSLDKGRYTLLVSLTGFVSDTTEIRVLGEGQLDFILRQQITRERPPPEINDKPTLSVTTIGSSSGSGKKPYRVRGKVIDAGTGETIPGATIYIEKFQIGTSSDLEGNFELNLYRGLYTMIIRSTGYEEQERRFNIIGNARLNFLMNEQVTQLDELVIEGEQVKDVVNRQVGKEVLSIASIKALPPLAGEADVLKSLTLLPGVSSPGEASSGFNVRGGGFDQNLILIDGAPLYNPSHMFGFFSAFNPNIIREVTLYKGAIPANYGGRGSSVVDIDYKRGGLTDWSGDLTMGMVSSKFSAGGPIVKNKLSLMVGGRGSYANWLLKRSSDPDVQNSRASFYDANAILSYALNDKNDLSYSVYFSDDSFQFAGDTSNRWQNFAQVLKWNYQATDRITLSTSVISSEYNSVIDSDIEFGAFEYNSGVEDLQVGTNVQYQLNERQSINVGAQHKWLQVELGSLIPDEDSFVSPIIIPEEKATESGLYFQHDADLTDWLTVGYGFRWSKFRRIGEAVINTYDSETNISEEGISGTRSIGDGEVFQDYEGFEPRGSVNVKFTSDLSMKLGYNKMYQYIHLISNTTSISPVDVWKLSDTFLKPQIVDQYSAGLFKNWNVGQLETSIEGYYKNWDNVVEYRDGADLFANNHLETELLTGIGRSYGVEAYLKKKSGRFNGWFSYTWSRSLRKVDGPTEDQQLNDGSWYPSNFDMPNNLTLVGRYRLGPYTTASAIFTYNTGRPVTLPNGKFGYQGETFGYFSERNGGRVPDYHRLDFSLQYESPSKKKLLAGIWTFSVYNLYGRKNAYSLFFRDFPGAPPQAFKVSVIGVPFPSISYELKF